MKISDFNNEYLTSLLAKIEKTGLLILNTNTEPNASDSYDILSSNFLKFN